MQRYTLRGLAVVAVLFGAALAVIAPAARADSLCPFSVTADQPAGQWVKSDEVTFTLNANGCQVTQWYMSGPYGQSSAPSSPIAFTGVAGSYAYSANVYYYGTHYGYQYVCYYDPWWGYTCNYQYMAYTGWGWLSNGAEYQGTYSLDPYPPTLNYVGTSGPAVGNIVGAHTDVVYQAYDSLSGLDRFDHSVDVGSSTSWTYQDWWSAYVFDHTTLQGPDGPRNLTVTAVDHVGNAVNDTRQFILDTTGPAVTLLAPSHDSVTTDAAQVTTCDGNPPTVNAGGSQVAQAPVGVPGATPLPDNPAGSFAVDACDTSLGSTASQSVPVPAQPAIGSPGSVPGTPGLPLGPAPSDPTGLLPPVVVGAAQDAWTYAATDKQGGALPTFGTPTDEAQQALGPLPASVPTSVDVASQKLATDSPMVISGTVDVTSQIQDQYAGTAFVEYFVDGSFRAMDAHGDGAYHWLWNTSLDTEGAHNLTILAVDKLGNENSETYHVQLVSPTAESTSNTYWQHYYDARNAIEQAPFTVFAAWESAPSTALAAANDTAQRAITLQSYAQQRSDEIVSVLGLP